MAAPSEGPASVSSDTRASHDAEVSTAPTGPVESPSLLEVQELSALHGPTSTEQAENEVFQHGALPKEDQKVSSGERPLSSSPIAPEYEAEMTPFQRKVVNVTLCFSLTVIAVAAFSILVVALTQHSKRLADYSLGCKSQQCLEATRYLSSVAERDLHPCVDMYSHVCNRWASRRRGVGFLPDALHLFLQRFLRQLRSTPDDALGEQMAPVIHIGKHLLDICTTYMNSTGSNSLQADIASVLEHADVAVLLDSNSSGTAFVRAINISFATGLHSAVAVARKKDNSNTFLHLISAPSIRRVLRAAPADDIVEVYVGDVIRHVSANADAASIARDVLDADSEVDTFAKGDEESMWIAAAELKKDAGFPSGFWGQAFSSATYQGVPVTDATVVLFTGYEQTKKVFQHLAEVRRRTTVWYLSVTIIAQVLRYDFARRFHPTHGHDTARLCFEAVNEALHLHWHYALRELSVTRPAADISQLMNSVFLSVHRLTVPHWLDEETTSVARARINKTSLETMAPSAGDGGVTNVNTTYLRRELQQSSAAKAQRSFPAKYVLFRALSHREAVQHNPPHWVTARMAALWAQPWPVYDALYGKIFLPAAYLKSPVFYDGRSTLPFVYGTVGAAMAKALADVVGPYSRWNATAPHKSHYSWWTTTKLLDAQLRLGCLRTRVDEDVLRHPNRNPHPKTSEAFKASAFAWIRAARVSHDAMRAAIYEDRPRDPGRDKYWSKAQRQFFARFCLMACGSERQDALRPRERCIWPLVNMPEFAKAFECRNESYTDLLESCAHF